MNKLKIIILIIACLAYQTAVADDQSTHNYIPKDGYVPDSKTAIKIAEAVLSTIYGESVVKKEKPLVASLKDDVWTIEGTAPKDVQGGTALIIIAKSDGRIIRVTHGK